MATVNTSSSTRAERAQETRRRMIGSARDLFIAQGYPDTTMTQIAKRAEVAVQTLYYTFQTKGRLLVEVVEVVAAGDDNPVPVPQRKWFQEMMSTGSAQRMFALEVEHGTGIYERVAVLWPVIAGAVSDAFVAEYWAGVTNGRRKAQRGQATMLFERGNLKAGLTVDKAADLLFLLAGHDPYRTLVQHAGWPIVEYKAWLFTTLVRQVLETTSVDPQAIADLSFAGSVK